MSKNTMHGVNLWLVLGAGLYWSSYSFRLLNSIHSYGGELGPNLALLQNLFMTAWVIAIVAICKCLGVRRARFVTSIAMLASSCIILVCDIVRPDLSITLSVIAICIDLLTLGACMVLWGIAFASLEKHLAANNVVATVLVACIIILAGLGLNRWIPATWMTDICAMGSAAILLSNRVTLRNQIRARGVRSKRLMASFGIQRLAFGMAIGFFPAIISMLAAPRLANAILVFSLVALVIALFIFFRDSRADLYALVPALVLASCWLLTLPYLNGGSATLAFPLLCCIWLSWQTFSSVQLSDLREVFGTSELGITLADKAAISVALLSGSLVFQAANYQGRIGAGLNALVDIVLPIASSALLLIAVYILSRLVTTKNKDAVSVQIEETSAQREERLFNSIAAEFGLTSRELEVTELLSHGYTSTFIADEMGVSQGTVRAHMAHIYQKLHVHHKDELLELVDDRAARMAKP